MKIKFATLTNFRGYKETTTINFNDLTVFVGRNDVGKSSILEALDIFFNEGKGVIKLDKADINVESSSSDYSIAIAFSDLPQKVIVDSTYETTLAEEFLLNGTGELEIIKVFNGSKCTGTYIKSTASNKSQLCRPSSEKESSTQGNSLTESYTMQ